jgi:pimeloyl-ACP methyl ester carboxylesterase
VDDRLPGFTPANTVVIGNVSLNYTSSGVPDASSTVVLIHGFGASLETWGDIVGGLSADGPVVRLDLKGHGFSSKPEDDEYRLDEQARLVVGFLVAVNLKRVILVGHSLGGGVSLLTYLQSRGRDTSFVIAGLVLIDSAGYRQNLPFFVKMLRNPALRLLTALSPSEFRARMLLNRVFAVKSVITRERIHRYAFFWDLPGSSAALTKTARNIVPPDIDDLVLKFRDISVPTLILWGEHDPVVPLENAYRFRQDIPNSRLAVFPATGHVPQEERPERVLAELRSFVKEIG